MATQEELNETFFSVNRVVESIERCAGVGEALQDVGKPLILPPVRIQRWFTTEERQRPTHYTTTRLRVIGDCRSALDSVRHLIFEDGATGELIRIEAQLESYLVRCNECIKQLEKGEEFQCLIKAQESNTRRELRFQLNEKGEIEEY